MSSKLIKIDARWRSVFSGASTREKFFEAIDNHDSIKLSNVLTEVYGQLNEVITLPDHRGILVFVDGVGIYFESDMGLTYGYHGAGPRQFNTFLLECGFHNHDAMKFKVGRLYRKDGSEEIGKIIGRRIRWKDYTSILFIYKEDYFRKYSQGEDVNCFACTKKVSVMLKTGGKFLVFNADRHSNDWLALRCQDCGFVTCWRCSYVETDTETKLKCPSCNSLDGPYLFPSNS